MCVGAPVLAQSMDEMMPEGSPDIDIGLLALNTAANEGDVG